MKIIVVGCGKIGSNLIRALCAEGHDVLLIDKNPALVDSVTNIYDIMGLCGNATAYETLLEAGVDKAALFIAVTGSDESNMLSCYLASKLGVSHTIARVRNPEYTESSVEFMREKLGISMMINPELLAANELFNILKIPSAVKVESFSRRKFEMIETILQDQSPIDGMRLFDLRNKYKGHYLICAVQRGDNVYIPDGNFILRSGDRINIAAVHTELEKVLKEMSLLKRKVRNIMLLGGSRTTYYLAKMLTSIGNSVKIIEKKSDVCAAMAELVPKSVVVHGDATNQELLLEEGLADIDALVALTGIDETNILMSIFALNHNVSKVIAKANSDELTSIADKLGLDCVIAPKRVVTDILIRYARGLANSQGSKVETLYTFMDGKVECVEFIAKKDSPVIGIDFKTLEIRQGILIAGILRGNKAIIPSGNDMILDGDRVVVISSHLRLNDLSEILK